MRGALSILEEGGGGLVRLDKQFLFVIVAHTLNVSRFPSSSEVTRAGIHIIFRNEN